LVQGLLKIDRAGIILHFNKPVFWQENQVSKKVPKNTKNIATFNKDRSLFAKKCKKVQKNAKSRFLPLKTSIFNHP